MEDFDRFEELARQYDQRVNKLVRKTALDIERGAKKRAPVLTGFLRQSIYTRTEDSSGFEKSSKRAGRRNSAAVLFPEIAQAAHNEAWVAVGASYGVFVEFGTHKMPARPYLVPAAEAVRQAFYEAIERIERELV